MSKHKFSLGDDFPPVGYDQWRAVVDRELGGAPFEKKLVTRTYEGIDIQPVYTDRDDPQHNELPGCPPFTRGGRPLGAVLSGWDLRPEYRHPNVQVANRAIRADLAGGCRSLVVRLDLAAQHGLDPDEPQAESLVGEGGVMVYSLGDLDQLLDGVQLDVAGVELQAGAAFLPAAAALVALWRKRDIPPEQARGDLAADPLAALAQHGSLPLSIDAALEMLADLAAWTDKHYPHVTAVGVDTTVYHHAGATASQDIALALATGTEYLRGLTKRDLDIDRAARQFLFSFAVGTHHFLSLAKLRAARRLWARVVELSGGEPQNGAMRIRARTSDRVLTERDPYVNLLRNTTAMFAAGLGGAEVLTSAPFDSLNEYADEFSRRVARNTVLVLEEEGHLNRVVDPAGGSWFLERLTDELAEKAWGIFQDIEREGGMSAALESGWVATQIDSAFAPRARDIARRKSGITGVSEFPNLAEEPIECRQPNVAELRQEAAVRLAAARGAAPLSATCQTVDDVVAAAASGASFGQMAQALGFRGQAVSATPLTARRIAAPFERLRDASDLWKRQHGSRPRVFLAPMGPTSHHTARVTYSRNFFEAGGFETIVGDGFDTADAAATAFADSGASMAVICSSDTLYPDVVPQLAPLLKSAGARTVVLAGRPSEHEEAWRSAGVDRFIFIGCDVLAMLQKLLAEEGVLAE